MITSKPPQSQTAALPRMLSVGEVATMFDRAPRTIRGWIARGLLKQVKVGNAVFIPEAQVNALVGNQDPVWSDPIDGS